MTDPEIEALFPLAALQEYERRSDALHFAITGCGYHVPRSGRLPPYDCGEDDGTTIKLCGKCEVKRDAAIRTLTSTRPEPNDGR